MTFNRKYQHVAHKIFNNYYNLLSLQVDQGFQDYQASQVDPMDAAKLTIDDAAVWQSNAYREVSLQL